MIYRGWHTIGTVRSRESAACLPAGVEARQVEAMGPFTEWKDILAGVHTVVHLASRVHITKDRGENTLPLYREVNVVGTKRLAEMAALSGVHRFIYLSSVKVHGNGTDHPYREDDIANPQDHYAQSKWEAEQILRDGTLKNRIEVVILRSPLVYGPGVRANFLRLMQVVDKGIPLPLKSNDNRRSMLFIGNLTDMIATCGSHPLAAGETFFVADYENVSTAQLIKLLAAALGRDTRLFSCPLSFLRIAGRMTGMRADIERLTSSLVVNCEKAKNILGWAPPISLIEGIAETVKWYKSQ